MSDPLASETSSIEDKTAYVDVQAMSVYDFMDDTFSGKNGYRDGKYLIPHPREVFYNTRRSSSYYKNFFKPVVRAMIDPVFSGTIKRTTTDNMLEGFFENCNIAGDSFQGFVGDAMYTARVGGVAFVVVDNYQGYQQPDTVESAIVDRRYPFVSLIKPQLVKDFVSDKFGQLEEIVFYDRKEKRDAGTVQLYRRWTRTDWTIFEVKGEAEVVVESGVHGLGVLPVVVVTNFSGTKVLKELPDPPLYDLARLNFALFNKESEIRTLEQNQSFSVLIMPDNGATNPVVGVHNYLTAPHDSTWQPNYISPDSAHLTNLVDNAEKLREDIYRIAHQNGVIGVKSEASGVAKEWDFRAEETVLRVTAQAAALLEYAVVNLFGRYTNSSPSFEVQYPERYSPTYEADRITTATKIIDSVPPKPLADALWEEITKNYWCENPDKASEVIEEMEAAALDESIGGEHDDAVAAMADDMNTGPRVPVQD